MPKGNKLPAPQRPSRPRWVFDSSVPTSEWFAGQSLDETWNLQDAVASFVYEMERGRFLTWEAVACHEQGLPLTAQQNAALNDLINFNDDDEQDDDRILYINDIARPSEPWDAILNQIVPHLLIESFRTADMQAQVKLEGFSRLMDAVRKHGQGLSLPPGITSPEEVVPAELRHKLWLQVCLDDLGGLGQEAELNLREQPDRIEWFIDHLRENKESVRFFGLTLESVLKRLILPEVDQPLFVEMMQRQLAMHSVQEPIADHL
ncbi:MAG: hypothetical protein NTU53_11315 [Planctomycetota bacterium]|nr:hypothetical protein [Planctomycetota bacterium]